MQVFIKVATVQKRINFLRLKGKTIGFVPTMGALHEGHISLVTESVMNNDVTVCSIFVNPTQFNSREDLLKYPRTKIDDTEKLAKAGVDILFYPNEKQIYPYGLESGPVINLNSLDKVWEGQFRPGHFAGVVQVVNRLLDIIKPDNLYMGQKDFQQFTIIDRMLKEIKSSINLIIVPTIREENGLAMSSRNIRLSSDDRKKAAILYKMLSFAKINLGKLAISDIEAHALDEIKNIGLKPEYFKIVRTDNLSEITKFRSEKLVAIVAAWAGEVRLIDNLILN
jgi:pantoate--beta-alanine ligase